MKCHPASALLPANSNMKIIIFHELVDRFSRRPRFPAAPRPNYRRLTIRHRDDSKKSTHPSPTRRLRPAASRSHQHFYKNADTDRDRPARSCHSTALPAPFVSFPLFTRRRGRHPGGGGDRANAKYWPSEKVASYHSHQSKPSPREHASLRRDFVARRESSACGLDESHGPPVYFSESPARRLAVRAQQVVRCRRSLAAHTTSRARTSHNFPSYAPASLKFDRVFETFTGVNRPQWRDIGLQWRVENRCGVCWG